MRDQPTFDRTIEALFAPCETPGRPVIQGPVFRLLGRAVQLLWSRLVPAAGPARL